MNIYNSLTLTPLAKLKNNSRATDTIVNVCSTLQPGNVAACIFIHRILCGKWHNDAIDMPGVYRNMADCYNILIQPSVTINVINKFVSSILSHKFTRYLDEIALFHSNFTLNYESERKGHCLPSKIWIKSIKNIENVDFTSLNAAGIFFIIYVLER